MSAAVLAKIAEYTAELEPIVDVPTELAFGSDLSCTDDLDAEMTELDEDDPVVIAQAIFHRITTPRGTLDDDEDYGIDIAEDLSVATDDRTRLQAAGRIKGEVLKDDRIGSCTVTITDDGTNRDVEIECVTKDPDANDFALVIAVVNGAALLKAINLV